MCRRLVAGLCARDPAGMEEITMKRIFFLMALVLFLAGCGGDFASPTDSHDETTTTTTMETQTAALEQSNTKQICVGLLNIGSCNQAQSNVQTASRPAGAQVIQPHDPGPTAAEIVCTVVALLAAFVVCMIGAMALMGNRGYN